jgi:enterochelin esterase-like enzyme
MPSMPLLLIFSMIAMGKERSCPKRIPIFFIRLVFRSARCIYCAFKVQVYFLPKKIKLTLADCMGAVYNNESSTFDAMEEAALENVVVKQAVLSSGFLQREVTIDMYLPTFIEPSALSLLLINDGQNLAEIQFAGMLGGLLREGKMQPVFCIGIHAGAERKMEYGTANVLDYEGRGAKAKAYQQFILQELTPYVQQTYNVPAFRQVGFAGFSLGGLMALDAAWNHPDVFSIAGVFSGSLWWRTRALENGYNEATDRIMHKQIREGRYRAGLRFYFTTGSLDETSDRNNNGIIDSIDDTLALIEELQSKGYQNGSDIHYVNYEDGRHDVATWGRAFPHFLAWAFPSQH